MKLDEIPKFNKVVKFQGILKKSLLYSIASFFILQNHEIPCKKKCEEILKKKIRGIKRKKKYGTADLKQIEEKNRLRINVLSYSPKSKLYYCVRRSKKPGTTINLVRTTQKKREFFFLIKDVASFLRHKKACGQTQYCEDCLQKHYGVHKCFALKKFQSELTIKDEDDIYFKNYNLKVQFPICGVFDFESINNPTICEDCKKHPCVCEKKSRVMFHQLPLTYCLIIWDTFKKSVLFEECYTGKDCAEQLILTLFKLGPILDKKLKSYPHLPEISKKEKKKIRQ